MRKPGLTEAEFRDAMNQVEAIYAASNNVPNIIGPTYGAALCDRALKIDRALHNLAVGIEDQAYAAGIRLDRPQSASLKIPAVARNELDGTFPLDTPTKGRLWPALTAREHHALGLLLKDARNRAQQLAVKLGGAFPQTTKQGPGLYARAQRVEKAISAIRNEMDTRAHDDCPTYGNVAPGHEGIGPSRSWYYGASEAH
jgi:hypothetical protein